MKHMVAVFCLTLLSSATYAQAGSRISGTIQKEAVMTARGTFNVKMVPQPADDAAGGPFSRLFLDKTFHGDLDATSKGQMMGAFTAVEGSAGYVALELVSGTLNGRKGSFIFQHAGTMSKGVPTQLSVTVVPDSGTEQLTGLTGTMVIIIAPDGKHSYEFEYTLDGGQQ
jgi:Protein of unknown function (DUF3224)